MSDTPVTDLQKAEALREERRAARQKAHDDQRAKDLVMLVNLEDERDGLVAHVEVSHVSGLPTMVIVGCPTKAHVKRYRDRCKPDAKGRPGDGTAAAEELASTSGIVLYPDADTYARMCDKFTGLHAQVGATASGLSVGKVTEEGKG
jgi:hypothetical protein